VTDTLPLARRLAAHLDATGLVAGTGRVVVACSGGSDSTALLTLLVPYAAERGIVLVPAHVGHGLRGEAGHADARAAADLARSLGLVFAYRPVEVSKMRDPGESLEAAARRLRYESLLLLAAELGDGTLVATGHTLDDQAETVLLNLERRSGRLRGGIRPRRADGVVRPLLPFTRAELRAHLAAADVRWREDETNEDERFVRNRIRRRTLPALEAASPGTAARLARAADAWTRRLDAIDARIDAELSAAATTVQGPFPRGLFVRLAHEEAGRLLVRAAGGSGRVPGRKQVARVLLRLSRGDARWSEALGGLRLQVDVRVVSLVRPVPARTVAYTEDVSVERR